MTTEFRHNSATVSNEVEESLARLDERSCLEAAELLATARRVFVLGLGRAGFMVRAFAMRLMHIGMEAYVVGETITPNYGEGDLLVVVSGSGETLQLTRIAEKAKMLGGKVLALTGNAGSTITTIADASVVIRAPSKDKTASQATSVQPMASLFEQTVLLLGDALVLTLMERCGKFSDQMLTRHANLE
jgi:6-phospho-3-hexuloisomerase